MEKKSTAADQKRYVSLDELTDYPFIFSDMKGSQYPSRSKQTIVLGENADPSQQQKIKIVSASETRTCREDQINYISEYRAIAIKSNHQVSIVFCSEELMDEYQQQITADTIERNSNEPESQLISSFYDMLKDAVDRGASDIHIEVRRTNARIRYRIDGELSQIAEWTVNFSERFVQAVYSVVAEEQDVTFKKDQPQDAVIDKVIDGQRIRVRLATIPAAPDGFDCIMRLLPLGRRGAQKILTLDELGYSSDHVRLINMGLTKPVGAIIIAGTTGSGKSTTLKNMLMAKIARANGSIKVITVEDPPEYFIPGATQVPVSRNRKTSDGTSSFEAAVRAAMRADPDLLMVGEVRDNISASLLVSAVQSGHQGFTTVHAASAISIIGRLASMHVDRDILGSIDFIACLIYQALLPKLCPHCKIPMASASIEKDLAVRINAVATPNSTIFFRGTGCDKCNNGIKGKTVVAEVILPDFAMLKCFAEGRSIDALQHWIDHGGKLIVEHGIEKMCKGDVSPHDVEHVVGTMTSQLVMKDGQLDAHEIKFLPETLPNQLSRIENTLIIQNMDMDSDAGAVTVDEIGDTEAEAEADDNNTGVSIDLSWLHNAPASHDPMKGMFITEPGENKGPISISESNNREEPESIKEAPAYLSNDSNIEVGDEPISINSSFYHSNPITNDGIKAINTLDISDNERQSDKIRESTIVAASPGDDDFSIRRFGGNDQGEKEILIKATSPFNIFDDDDD